MRRLAPVLAALVLTVAGCSASNGPATGTGASQAPQGSANGDAQSKLSELGLAGKDVTAIIDGLDVTQKDKQIGLHGSVRQDELVLTVGDDKEHQTTIAMPRDKTYVSVAPFVSRTHECFNHHLTGCQGEQVGKSFEVTVTAADGRQLMHQQLTTYENGFVGFWLPRDVQGTLSVSGEAGKGAIPLSTAKDAPTCITTLKLS